MASGFRLPASQTPIRTLKDPAKFIWRLRGQPIDRLALLIAPKSHCRSSKLLLLLPQVVIRSAHLKQEALLVYKLFISKCLSANTVLRNWRINQLFPSRGAGLRHTEYAGRNLRIDCAGRFHKGAILSLASFVHV